MDVIPLKAELVKGSHGRIPESTKDWPVLIRSSDKEEGENVDPTSVYSIIHDVVNRK